MTDLTPIRDPGLVGAELAASPGRAVVGLTREGVPAGPPGPVTPVTLRFTGPAGAISAFFGTAAGIRPAGGPQKP